MSQEAAPRGSGRLTFALLLVLPPLLLHLHHLGPGRLPYYRDLARFMLPPKRVAMAAMRHGELPLWSMGHGAGTPLFADPAYFHLHPATLIFLLLPDGTAFSLSLAAMSVALACGTGLWLRERGASPVAAATGAAALALGGLGASLTNLFNLLTSYAAVPWALWASERLGRRPGGRWLAALAAIEACALLGGEPTAWGWCVVLPLWLGSGRRSGRALALHAASAALSIGLTAAQLVPLGSMLDETARGTGFTLEQSTYRSVHPRRLTELYRPYPWGDPLAPPAAHAYAALHLTDNDWPLLLSLYAGVTVLGLATAGVAWGRGGGRWLLLPVGGLSIVLALGRHTPVFPLLWRLLPPLHSFRYPEKLLLPLFLVLAGLTALGVDALRRRAPRLPPLLLPLAVAAELLSVHLHLVPGGPAARFLEAPAAAALLQDGRTYAWRTNPPLLPDTDDPLVFALSWQELLSPPAGLPFGVRYVFDPDPDKLDYERMVGLGQIAHRAPGRREPMLRLAAVKHVTSPAPLREPWLRDRGRASPPFVYDLEEPMPWARVFAAAAVRWVGSPSEAARLLASPDLDPGEAVVVEGVSGVASEPAPDPKVTWRRPRPSRLELTAGGPGLLYVAEAYTRDWSCRLDGQPAPILPANLAFMGLLLPEGPHEVSCDYRPRGLTTGLGLTALSLAILAGLLLTRPRGPRPVTSGSGPATA